VTHTHNMETALTRSSNKVNDTQ